MSESTYALAVVACFVVVAILFVTYGSRRRRRRAEAFAFLASSYGADLERATEWEARFVTTFDGREIEIRDVYEGGGSVSQRGPTQTLTIRTELRGQSWDLHSVDITRKHRTSEVFEEAFNVRDLGMPMGERWLTSGVRSAIAASFTPAHSLNKISIDAGHLVYVIAAEPRELLPATLKSLLAAHTGFATQVERAR